MKKLQPLGDKIIVLPIAKKELDVTEGGIAVIEGQLEKGTVVSFPKEYKDVYKKGDTILYRQGAGVSHFCYGDTHLIMNGNGAPSGDVWAIETDGI